MWHKRSSEIYEMPQFFNCIWYFKREECPYFLNRNTTGTQLSSLDWYDKISGSFWGKYRLFRRKLCLRTSSVIRGQKRLWFPYKQRIYRCWYCIHRQKHYPVLVEWWICWGFLLHSPSYVITTVFVTNFKIETKNHGTESAGRCLCASYQLATDQFLEPVPVHPSKQDGESQILIRIPYAQHPPSPPTAVVEENSKKGL